MAMLSSRALQAQAPLPGEAAAHDPMDTEADCWQDSLETQADASEPGTTIPASLPSPSQAQWQYTLTPTPSTALTSSVQSSSQPVEPPAARVTASGLPAPRASGAVAPREGEVTSTPSTALATPMQSSRDQWSPPRRASPR